MVRTTSFSRDDNTFGIATGATFRSIFFTVSRLTILMSVVLGLIVFELLLVFVGGGFAVVFFLVVDAVVFFGGVVFAAFAGFLISKFYIQPTPEFSNKSILIWMIIALIVSVFGTIGDLIESKFKRIAGVKDSGSIMPGHGGVLDRLDSVIFVAPVIYLFYQILYYVS